MTLHDIPNESNIIPPIWIEALTNYLSGTPNRYVRIYPLETPPLVLWTNTAVVDEWLTLRWALMRMNAADIVDLLNRSYPNPYPIENRLEILYDTPPDYLGRLD